MTRQYCYIFFLLSSLFMLAATGCNREKTNLIFHENFIEVYETGSDLSLHLREEYDNPPYYHIRIYYSDYPSKIIDKESSPARFRQLAERNGDTSFNQWIDHWAEPGTWPYTVEAWADNFQSMHVTSDADWDEGHPAGTPLDDILRIKIQTYTEFVQSGYQTYPATREKFIFISELSPDDMKMIAPYPTIHFTSAPTISPAHTLTLEWTTVEGRALKASLDCSEVTETMWREARKTN